MSCVFRGELVSTAVEEPQVVLSSLSAELALDLFAE